MKAAYLLLALTGLAHLVAAQTSAPSRTVDPGSVAPTTEMGVHAGLSWSDLQSTSQPLLGSSFERLRTFHLGGY